MWAASTACGSFVRSDAVCRCWYLKCCACPGKITSSVRRVSEAHEVLFADNNMVICGKHSR